MNNYKFDSIVSRSEADALKEMIFKRVRERAEALNNDIQESYTSDVRSEVMDIARSSFVSEKNPFSQVESPHVEDKPVEKAAGDEIGFPKRHAENIRAHIEYRNKLAKEAIVNNELEQNMKDAGREFSKNQGFTGALNFLNSQASIALVKSRGKVFEAMA